MFSPEGHFRRFTHPCRSFCLSRIHFPASLPSTRLCFPRFSVCVSEFRLQGGPHARRQFPSRCALVCSSVLQYYEGSDSCLPSLRATGLPACLTQTSQRSASNHAVYPGIAFHAISVLFQRAGRVSDFAMSEQARRYTPPNRVRFTADRQFVSSCSPPHLAMTQLPVSYTHLDVYKRQGLN